MERLPRKTPGGPLFGFSLFCLLVLMFPLLGQEAVQPKEPAKKNAPASVEAEFTDGSVMKLALRDENIELETSYGKLLIPVADVRRIEFGMRISDDVRKRIETAIGELGSPDFRRRQAATSELQALKEKAYPALLRIASGKDAEAGRRVEQIIEKIRESVRSEILEIPAHDVVHTADSKIAGRIKADLLRVATLPFGDQQVKVADLRTLRSPNSAEPEVAAAGTLLDPGALHLYQNQIGKTLSFRVTGPPAAIGMQMGVYGTDVYTLDSSLAAAAVHAGAIQAGKTGVVRVTIVGPQAPSRARCATASQAIPMGPGPASASNNPEAGPRIHRRSPPPFRPA